MKPTNHVISIDTDMTAGQFDYVLWREYYHALSGTQSEPNATLFATKELTREPMVAVPLRWLTGLSDIAKKIDANQDPVRERMLVATLTGYASSVEALIKYAERIQDV